MTPNSVGAVRVMPLADEALAFLADVFEGRSPGTTRWSRPPAPEDARTASKRRGSPLDAAWDRKEEELLADLRGCCS
jgi:hypothetical protein